MKRKINLGKRLSLNKEKLSQLNEEQLTHFLGGRMAAATQYTETHSTCSIGTTCFCSVGSSSCCG